MIRFNHLLNTWEFLGCKGRAVPLSKKQARQFHDAGYPVVVSETVSA